MIATANVTAEPDRAEPINVIARVFAQPRATI
jgi:hypothetical protein